MQSTFTIDDALLAEARALAEPGISDKELLRQCMNAFIRQQSARRLTALGGEVLRHAIAAAPARGPVRRLTP